MVLPVMAAVALASALPDGRAPSAKSRVRSASLVLLALPPAGALPVFLAITFLASACVRRDSLANPATENAPKERSGIIAGKTALVRRSRDATRETELATAIPDIWATIARWGANRASSG